ncbi:helix-turn-helix domain-containing protein [Nonomuraea antimicrobica]|uniref:Helix-turn-helix domain-containing protein n=1 Tax=Nonomuraea antimicrobica TaxID=561173 RepID=A0ABP7BBH6_9ACTN
MLPRTYPDINCSIARTLEVVGERWTLLVVRNALAGMTRFEKFQQSLGMAPNVLADRLSRLTDAGVLSQRQYSDRPARFEYVPTAKGRNLWPVLAAMVAWGDRYYAPDGSPRLLVHDGCGGRIAPELTCTTCSTTVDPDAVTSVEGPGETSRST